MSPFLTVDSTAAFSVFHYYFSTPCLHTMLTYFNFSSPCFPPASLRPPQSLVLQLQILQELQISPSILQIMNCLWKTVLNSGVLSTICLYISEISLAITCMCEICLLLSVWWSSPLIVRVICAPDADLKILNPCSLLYFTVGSLPSSSLALVHPRDFCIFSRHPRQGYRAAAGQKTAKPICEFSRIESAGNHPPLGVIIHSNDVDHKWVYLLDKALPGDFLMNLRKLTTSFPQRKKILCSVVSAHPEEKICHQYSACHYSSQLKWPFIKGERIEFTEYFILFKLIVTMMAFAEHLTQRDECKPLTVKPVLFTLDLSNSVKQILPCNDKAKERVILKTYALDFST